MTTPAPTDQTATSIPSPPVTIDGLADQIRQLATQINQPPYNFDPTTIRKATVTAIDPGTASSAPTCTVLFSGDTTSPVSGVRFAAIFGPQVGDTVIVLKQASDFFLLTDIAGASNQTASSAVGGWTQASLAGGHSHGGNANGNLMYRRVMDNGCWKVQWKGAINYGGSTSVLSAGLGGDFRPAAKVSMISSRTASSSNVVGIDFDTDGTVSIVGPTVAPSEGSAGGISVGDHQHTYTDYYGASGEFSLSNATSANGSFSTGGHQHGVTVAAPTWVGFNGIEYFLG